MPQSTSMSGMTKGKMHELSILLELQGRGEENIPTCKDFCPKQIHELQLS